MADPEKKSETPTEAPSSEVSQSLGLDRLEDKQKQAEVSSYFEKKVKLSELQHEKQQNLRDLMDKKMEEFNRTRASSADIIQGITQKILEDAREKDINDVFYPEFVRLIDDEVNVDLEGADANKEEVANNAVFKKAWAIVGGAIRSIPLTIKRQYVRDYAFDMMKQYATEMDAKAETLAFNWGTLHENELKQIKAPSFGEWAAEPGRPSKDELNLTINPVDAKAFVEGVAAAKLATQQVQESITGLPNNMTEFFTGEVKAIEGYSTDNPQKAIEDTQKLSGAIKAAIAVIALQTAAKDNLAEITTLKGQVTDLDPALESGYTDLQTKVDKQLQDYMSSKDAKKLDAAVILKQKTDLDAKLAEAKAKAPAAAPAGEQPAPGAEGAAPAEAPNPLKDPEGYMQDMMSKHPVIFAILSALGLDKAMTKIMERFKKKSDAKTEAGTDGSAGGAATGPGGEKPSDKAPEDPKKAEEAKKAQEELTKSKNRLKDRFHLKTEEVALILDNSNTATVADFVKLKDPPSGVDKSRFEAVQKAFKANGANEKNTETVVGFYQKREQEWKAAKG